MKFNEKTGYKFNDESLLQNALTHSSYINESKKQKLHSNERLEFLGDSVLELVISEYLYKNNPDLSEGELTKLRASIVCEPSIANAAREIGLGRELFMGRGESSVGRDKDSILCDAYEALIGAVYLDGGYDAARDFIIRKLEKTAAELRYSFMTGDYKSRLQEELQRESLHAPVYEVTGDFDEEQGKRFTALVLHEGKILGQGAGKSKKDATQNAAKNALESLSADKP